MKLHVKKTVSGLIPVHNSDRDKLTDAKLKLGEIYEVEIKKPRNYEFHKKFISLVNLFFDNQDFTDEFDNARYYLTMKAGYYKEIHTKDGIMYLPKSIAFDKMDEIEFKQLYQKAIDTVIKLLGITEGDLMDEILNYM